MTPATTLLFAATFLAGILSQTLWHLARDVWMKHRCKWWGRAVFGLVRRGGR